MTLAEFINKVGFKVNEQDVQKVNDTVNSIASTATKLLGAIGVGFSLAAIKDIVEEFGAVNDSIKSAVGELKNMDEVQQSVLEGANDARTSYSEMASTVSDLTKAAPDLFPVGEAVKFSSTVTKLLKTSGRSQQQIASITEGLNKSFKKGVVETETLNVLLEQSPEAANLLARHLGVAKTKLEEMATNGQISVTDLKDAFMNSAEEIDAAFAGVDMKITDALQNIRNQWGLWLTQTDKTLGVTKSIAKVMTSAFNGVMSVLTKVRTGFVWLSEKIGGSEKLLKLITIVAGSMLLAFNFGKIKTGLTMLSSLLKGVQVKTLAITAVIVLLALLVEDFINFMNGNDSLIGTFLEKAGINTEEVRESFKGLGEQFKQLFGIIKELGSVLLSSLVQILAMVIEVLMELMVAILPVIIDLLETLIPVVVEIIEAILPVIIDLIKQLLPIIQSIIKGILPILIKLIQTLVPIILKIIQTILPVFIQLLNTIIPLVLQIIQSILPIILNLINTLLPLLMQIIEAILPVVIDLINTLLPIVMQIIDMILPILIQLIQELIPFILQIIETILPIIIELINVLLPIIVQIIEAVLPILLELINALLPPLMSILEAILPVIIELVTALLPVLQPILELVATLAETLLPIIVTVLEAIIPIIQTISDVLGPVFDVISMIIDAISTVVGWVADGLGWLIDLFFDTGDPSETASGVSGYADGTEYTDDTFIAGEEGPELITGQRGKKVFTALETGNIFNNLGALASAGTVSRGTASVVNNNSDVRKSVVQNVNINNEFNGERAFQESASDAMDDSARDITAELARGLSFVG